MDTSNSEWERFEELLPWYVNHSLSGEERDWVVDYIARNPEARKVCDNEQEWFTLLQEGLFPFPVEENFQKLMAGLEVESRQRTPPVSWWSRLRAWLVPADTGRMFGFSGSRAALAMACTVILAQAVVIGSLWWGRPSPDSERLTTGDVPLVHGRGVCVERACAQIAFRPKVTERELRLLLYETGADIVEGPTQFGEYTIAVPLSSANEVFASLRSHAIVDSVTLVTPTR